MPIVQDARGNTVETPPGVDLPVGLKLKFEGDNNRLVAHGPFETPRGLYLEFSSNGGRCDIGQGSSFGSGIIRVGRECSVEFGAEFSVTKEIYLEATEAQTISFGPDCMVASYVTVRTGDGHVIFDRASGERINPSRSIKVGAHVWLGDRSTILGGADIGDGCIVGAQSLLKKRAEPHCLVAGVPAKLIRENIEWSRQGLKRLKPGMISTISDLPEALRYPWDAA